MDCFGVKDSSVSHANSSRKSVVVVQWTAPATAIKTGKVVFKATVVKHFDDIYQLSQTVGV
jgi:hypothetical protein